MTDQQAGWALIVHGGAKEMEPDEEQAHREGIQQALAVGRERLESGASAIDAVEAAVRKLEELPAFNAARGAALNERGDIEMSAALMSGLDRSIGAIAGVGRVKSPIAVARKLMPEKPVLLAGEGAVLFAEQQGAEFVEPADYITDKQIEALAAELEEKDTVGAVALDMSGNLAAATATGGLTGTMVGRVSDSVMPGCGFYADNHIGAIAVSGDGESIARLMIAAQVMAKINQDGPEEAIRKAIEQVPHLGGDAGAIAIAKDGRIGWWHNSPYFVVALASSDAPEGRAFLKKDEEQRG